MSKGSSSYRFISLTGILIIVILVWQFRGDLLPDKEVSYDAESLLNKVISRSATNISWNDIKRITFKKDFNLYKEDGTIEITRSELHSYDYTRGINRLLQWKQDSINYNLIEKNNDLFQTVNNRRDTTVTRVQLQNKLNAATFVLGLPHTLANNGSSKKYNGIQDFEGTQAHELEIIFTNSSDIWKMYYEVNSLDWLGYWVKTSDHYSLVINEQMTEVNGFTFSRKRKSYRTDSKKNRLYLRADYVYSNFVVD